MVVDGLEIASFETTISTPDLELTLKQNYPNPFNPSTTISFTLPRRAKADLLIYTSEGKLVTTLVDAVVPAGRRDAVWDGTNAQGYPVSSGVYFCHLRVGADVLTRKMLLLK